MILQKWIVRRSPFSIHYFRNFYHRSFYGNSIFCRTTEKNSCKLSSRLHYPVTLHLAQFHRTSINQNENNEKVRHSITIINPFKYISLKIKIFLMRSFFDENFNEKEFLAGAKQAIFFVSEHIAEGRFSEMNELCTKEGITDAKAMYEKFENKSDQILVKESELLNLSFSDLDFEYESNGQKFVYAHVVYYCLTADKITKSFGNIGVEIAPLRIFTYSFRREYTPGISGDWLVDQLDLNIQSLPSF
ncbi:m-AAA protease-interacting protein 1, mitochondrial isoform X2 [Hydra vulgaris]|uniref:M-AAA protease-interacting protein 1, mitochondrial isoform X2 n=1 Tax=Hydra vulgaris TaxID=6087 RepID=A0ABM4C1X2_HYDVU